MNAISAKFHRLIPLVFGLFLGGCWLSAEPLLNSENASEIPFPGEYTSPDGGSVPVVISEASDNLKYEISMGDESHQVYFLSIGNGWFVLQMVDPATEPEPIDLGPDLKGTRQPTDIATYQLLGYSGDVVRVYKTDCTEEIAGLVGIRKTELGCLIEDISGLQAAASQMATAIAEGRLDAEVEDLRPLVD